MRTTGATDAHFGWGIDSLTIREQDAGGVQLYSRHAHSHREQNVWLDVPASDRNQIAGFVADTDHRIVRVDDLRALHNVALNFREHVASGVVFTMLNRAGGDMESDAMDEAGEKARAAWNARYPEFAEACTRIEELIGEAE